VNGGKITLAEKTRNGKPSKEEPVVAESTDGFKVMSTAMGQMTVRLVRKDEKITAFAYTCPSP